MADQSGETVAAFRIGQRVHAAGDPRRTGTIRYIGPISGHDGEWIGVDWDADSGGKHDGTVNGTRYFSARTSSSGSFVRAKALSAGISFLDAVYRRYRGESTKEEEDEMYVFSTSQRRVSVELVGKNKVEEKLKKFEEILGISVSFMGVSSVEPLGQISTLLPKLKELDLSGNLLSNWQDIASLCEALLSLQMLDLTSNLMEHEVTEYPSLKNIHLLVLNNCGITWDVVEKLKVSVPLVAELHLMANELKMIEPTAGPFVQEFNSLRLLNLEANNIDSWDEILKLSHLRSLEELHLNKNKLKTIYYPSSDASCVSFENLQCLLLGRNDISDVASVDSLNSFPSLVDVRLSENPVADPAKGGVPRFVLIARLSKVKILNGSEISPRERRESEIRYIRLIMAKMQLNNLEEIHRAHPRFVELKALHGIEDEKLQAGGSGPQTLASTLINLTLKCVGPSMGEKQSLTKKLPPSVTVAKLKALCESFFKLKDIKLRLFLEEKGSPLPLPLDDDMATLMELGLGTEATIIIDEEN
ncbi:Tubulin-specific chaperone E [Rhynchospora pubera]|uniref:Tubulin-specific chaperone E n=1 Tax=Rhynchospora pubera TaxID=906938 RepID=A0AAV8H4U4_9POAL|nr:Tubulin-specific chaperone E [Rhynchospora pubera]